MSKETQKGRLSPLLYLKHNRGRTLTLVISLGVFAMMVYTLGYFIGATTEPFYREEVANYEHYTLVVEEFELPEYETAEEWDALASPAMYEMRDKTAGILGTDDVFVVRRGYARMKTIMGNASTNIWYFDSTDDMDSFADQMGVTLVSGRMPQAPGELVVDRKCLANNGDALLNTVSDNYHIVGEIDSEFYLIYGLPLPAENNYMLMVMNGGRDDVVSTLEDNGMKLATSVDLKKVLEANEEALQSLENIKVIFTAVAGTVLGLCIVVVISMHIKDRHEEWCLMNSIGFPVGEIYLTGMKELLICFGAAFAGGMILAMATVLGLKFLMLDPIGLPVDIFRPHDLGMVLLMFLAVFAVCQIPMFLRMRAITTVDNIE